MYAVHARYTARRTRHCVPGASSADGWDLIQRPGRPLVLLSYLESDSEPKHTRRPPKEGAHDTSQVRRAFAICRGALLSKTEKQRANALSPSGSGALNRRRHNIAPAALGLAAPIAPPRE